MGRVLVALAAASSVLDKRSRLTESLPSCSERSGLTVKQRLVRPRLQFGAHCRQIDLNVDGGERRRHHEDNEQHQHHVDERRDVDLMDLVQRVLAMVETYAHNNALASTLRYTARLTLRRTTAPPRAQARRRQGARDRGSRA